MSDTPLKIEVAGAIAHIILNRPEKLNALSEELLIQLQSSVKQLEDEDSIRVLILRGEGRAFSSGFDLTPRDRPHTTPQDWRKHARLATEAMLALWNSPLPSVAMVHSFCLGGACDLAFVCDLTIAADDAKFSEPEIQFGTGPVINMIPWLTGMKAAKLLMLTGDQIDAAEALRLGLVTQVVSRDDLERETQAYAHRLATVPKEVMGIVKSSMNHSYEVRGWLPAAHALINSFSLGQLTRTEERAEFKKRSQNDGFRAAYEWVQKKHEEEIAVPETGAGD